MRSSGGALRRRVEALLTSQAEIEQKLGAEFSKRGKEGPEGIRAVIIAGGLAALGAYLLSRNRSS